MFLSECADSNFSSPNLNIKVPQREWLLIYMKWKEKPEKLKSLPIHQGTVACQSKIKGKINQDLITEHCWSNVQ